ncbi:glycosyltransferase family 2 protein [Superficieibacter sp. HKU1]|uniref:glycosyltransferase n=1 Tax=Superficieibacter sp. HKU1 TaxID=3031919 RepID=UPI0023E252AF|nr:glycosyltransferase family 2 protein [Superficieibacter sp. HKU1]WES68341.1 glycosyltransferase family 2 protein [Superficieibacter sp. HKU1]
MITLGYFILYLGILLLLTVSFLNFIRFRQSIFFLKQRKFKTGTMPTITSSRHIILIPALREQERIIPTIEYFLDIIPSGMDISITICTTDKEITDNQHRYTTQEVVEKFIIDHPGIPVFVCNYPDINGSMAHQLNYTIKKYAEAGRLDKKDYISIYNADSRPHKDTFTWVLSQLNGSNEKYVFQQSAVFLRNYSGLSDLSAKAVALYQSCWTLTHEIPRLRRQAEKNSMLSKLSNVHCVGHGLFIRFDILHKMGLFPVETLTEDTYLGYKLRCAGIVIYPVPYIEIGDSPLSMRSALKQKYVWYWGPMLYPYYFFKNLQEEHNIYLKLRSIILACQGILNAVRWIIVGPVIFSVLILPWLLSANILDYILSFISIILYTSLPVLGLPYFIDVLEAASGQDISPVREPWYRVILNLIYAVFHSLLHSIPPFFSLTSALIMIFTGRTPKKPKTDE